MKNTISIPSFGINRATKLTKAQKTALNAQLLSIAILLLTQSSHYKCGNCDFTVDENGRSITITERDNRDGIMYHVGHYANIADICQLSGWVETIDGRLVFRILYT